MESLSWGFGCIWHLALRTTTAVNTFIPWTACLPVFLACILTYLRLVPLCKVSTILCVFYWYKKQRYRKINRSPSVIQFVAELIFEPTLLESTFQPLNQLPGFPDCLNSQCCTCTVIKAQEVAVQSWTLAIILLICTWGDILYF